MIPPLARRFVAGESPAVALEHVRTINEREVSAIVNLLGEHYDDRASARADAEEYRELVRDIGTSPLDACISVKPTQLGLDVGEAVFRDHLESVVAAAAEHDVFVWIDMEDHTTTDATLEAYVDLAEEYGTEPSSDAEAGVGVCLQANLRRTREDAERLADVPGKVRFVKGAYDEPADVAYTDPERIDRELETLLTYAFEEFDGGIAVGSHDPAMIDHAIDCHEEYGTDFEIQMLMGVRESRQYDLATDYEVAQYVPYGDRWLSYFYRRLSERKENLILAGRALLGR
ncbi:proline dehydrogenase family protein [Halopiger goleimassiliensis]|uniref:proline dehydrogenase family protein n=1 Tax=Halopiger goleimassiliensis TaxID=1293048 RepID=UPI0006782BC3|nr:proline dehydrogenase family protein [Halopiger goleimassiliensis]